MSRTHIRPWIVGVTLTALLLLCYQQDLFKALELKGLDLRFQLRGALSPTLPIVLVSIDEDSFDELNLRWPWPRSLHAQLIRKLVAAETRLIGLDILFPEASNADDDAALAEAMRDGGNVILAAELTHVRSPFGTKSSMKLPIETLRDAASGYGPVNLITAEDGVVRTAKPFLEFQNRTYPSFAYQIYRRSAPQATSGEPSTAPMGINFRGPGGTYPVIPYYRILRDEIPQSLLRDKIVLIGAFASSLKDTFFTPFSTGRPTAGVEVQANLVETLVAGDALRFFPRWAEILILLLTSLFTTHVSVRLRPYGAFGVVLFLVAAYSLISVYLFVADRVVAPLAVPLLGMGIIYGAITVDNYVREHKERVRLRSTFSRYVAPEVVEEILEDREGLALGGKRRHITVLFTDIRGFTTISEATEPEQVVSILDDYLTEVTRVIFAHGGTVDKFIGDAVMAIFGAPKAHEDDAARAVRAGLDLVKMMDSLGEKWTKILGRPFQIGVGINTGDAVVGRIGSDIRSDFTAIGDTVNTASRLEGLTKELHVPLLVSETTVAELVGSVRLRPLGKVTVAGREAPVLVYTGEGFFSEALDSQATQPYVQQKK